MKQFIYAVQSLFFPVSILCIQILAVTAHGQPPGLESVAPEDISLSTQAIERHR